jgi:hypothetical protein
MMSQQAPVRRGATILAAVAAFVGLSGCAAQLGSMAPSEDMLLPHSVLLKPAPLDRGTFDVSVYKGAVVDSALPPLAKVVMSERDLGARSEKAVVVSQWGPPQSRHDSLLVDSRSLEPLWEQYVAQGVRYEYTFDGPRVRGTIDRPGAAPQRVSATYDEPMFALHEVGPLVCSLEHYRAGMTEIVPVFSATDETVQHDTLSVLRPMPLAGRAPGWVVRFTTPGSTTDYVVDTATRRIVDAVSTRRDTGTEIRYQYPGATG